MNSPLTDERLREIMAQTEPQECYAGCTDPDCPYMHNGPIAPDIGEVHALIQELLSLRQKDGEMGPAMWAEVVQDEYTGDIVWRCNEADNRDGPHDEPMIELNPATFALGTKINITEPALSTLSPQEPDNG